MTAEECLAHILSVKVETIENNPNATLTISEAVEGAKSYSQQVNAELLEALEALAKYFEFMIKDPNFHEYKNAIAVIKRARGL